MQSSVKKVIIIAAIIIAVVIAGAAVAVGVLLNLLKGKIRVKKLYCVVFTVLFILNLSGCKKRSDVTVVTSGLVFIAQINQNDSEIVCEVSIDENGKSILYIRNNK